MLLILLSCVPRSPPDTLGSAERPPVAERRLHTETVHGVTLSDDYFWMRDREDPALMPYLKAENDYTEHMLDPLSTLRTTLFTELLGRILEDDTQVPYRDGEWWYYTRTTAGAAYPIHCRSREPDAGEEQIILDENALAEGLEYLDVVTAVSPSGGWLAYGVDDDGSETYTLYFVDLASGAVLEESIPDTAGDVVWADEETIFYTLLDDTHRPDTVRRHTLGQPEDVTVLTEADERFYVSLSRTRSDAYVVISSESAITTEQALIDTADPTGAPVVVEPRRQGVEYRVSHQGERLYVVSNADGAVNFRLLSAPQETPGAEHWSEVIPYDPAVQLISVDAFAGHLVLWERAGGLRRLRVLRTSDGQLTTVEQPEPVYSVWEADNAEYDTTTFRFSYESLTTPDSLFALDLETQERALLREKPVLGGYERDRYTAERITARASDGAEIPISLVYRTDLRQPGGNPTLLTGYGAYGISYDPYFSANRISLLDRGVVFAIAHVRGGGELGRPWYEAGKFLNKKNTFTDFVTAGQHLRDSGITSTLAAEGGSAGGLLIGASVNLAPDLFDVAIAEVPFVDVINTMRDESIPLTVTEWEEWGNPSDEAYFHYMLSYSPYDNVAAVDYPAMLITGGLNDPRVGYWEPAKWTARLRAVSTGSEPLLLKMNMGAGHYGASGRYGYLEDLALTYAFTLSHLGATELQ